MTIKIIPTKGPSEANLQAVEREELIIAAARMVAAASGNSDPSNVDQCASKIRSCTSSRRSDIMDRLAMDVSVNLSRLSSPQTIVQSMDIDIERVMKLLEG